jgi:cell division septation protein DedD
MREVFDDEEIESARESRDREVTLGTGSVLAIVAGLVVLCGVCFGLGYAMGHESPAPSSSAAPQPATDQEPLQANGNIPKPSAVEQTPVTSPAEPAEANPVVEPASSSTSQAASNPAVASPPAAAGQPAAQPEVRPALPTAGAPGAANSAQQGVHSALPQAAGQQFVVQVAAVANVADADVLSNALKKRGYAVISKREPADNFIHVRVGPFDSRALAEQWRMKLLSDGYNAQVQP